MTGGEASIAAALGAPAGAFASDLAGGVHAKTADGHENMLARLHPDGDEAARAGFAIGGESAGGEGSAKQAGLDEDIRNAARAVVSVVFDAGVAATADVGLVLEGVGSVNRVLELGGGGGSDGGETAVEADLGGIANGGSGARGGDRGGARSGTGGGSSGGLLGVVSSPSLGIGLLQAVVSGPSGLVLGVSGSLLLGVGGLGVGSGVVTGGVVTLLSRGGSNESREEEGGGGDEGVAKSGHGCF
mgnify:CR=1 FL=1